ncbi:DUF2987 domain-containing protein [Shewanella intestini]|uniref:DUF2987 domain-containing protein n=1 Tax=Shewanella intestini TaxID=2017544 RepID=A0ABS5HZR6_9GAMM|nr:MULTISPECIES: DUF2987 domain-containing protein [Shewanella]MBR9727282.1 DUF2987 domain-containing protein [Shewanella intestini]
MRQPLVVTCCISAMLLGSSFYTPSVSADSIKLHYAGFYDKLKRAQKSHHPLVDLVFSVPKKAGCLLQSGFIATEKDRFPLTYNAQQRIFVPYDSQLKSDRAQLNLTFDGDATQCAIAMQVRVKSVKSRYSRVELFDIMQNMDTLLGSLRGFPMKHFAEPVAGVNVHFSDVNSTLRIDGVDLVPTDNPQHFIITKDQLDNKQQLQLSNTDFVMSPYIIN